MRNYFSIKSFKETFMNAYDIFLNLSYMHILGNITK